MYIYIYIHILHTTTKMTTTRMSSKSFEDNKQNCRKRLEEPDFSAWETENYHVHMNNIRPSSNTSQPTDKQY